jgi:hypothetical protein
MTLATRVALLITAVAIAAPAAAQQPTQAQRDAIKSACRSDFMAQCSGVQPGGQAALSCLQQHSASLSQPCQQAVGALSPAGSAKAPSGSAGTKTPATATAPATPATPAAPAATGAMPTFTPRQELSILRETCGPSFQAFCSGVPLGGGRGIACLRQNMARLSPDCKKVLSSGL